MPKKLKKVNPNIGDLIEVPWETLKTYEVNTLKVGERPEIQKLKNMILKRGFNFPLHVWEGHQYVIDGTGRMNALKELEKEGYQIPPIKCIGILADDFSQAKKRVLELNNQYGKVTQESFSFFVEDIQDDEFFDMLIDFEYPTIEFEPEDPEFTPSDGGDGGPSSKVVKTIPGDVYEIGEHGHLLKCTDTAQPELDQLMASSMDIIVSSVLSKFKGTKVKRNGKKITSL